MRRWIAVFILSAPFTAVAQEAPAPAPAQTAPVPAHNPARVSSGVVAGLKISGDTPAPTPGVRGSVVVHAVIGEDGKVIEAKAISGPMQLEGKAVMAVKTWRYKPYILNGAPVEVDTTILINFR